MNIVRRNMLSKIPKKDLLNPRKLYYLHKVKPYTLLNYRSLSKLYDLAKLVEKNNIEGDFVEVGCWNGGAGAIMGVVNKLHNETRKVWYLDTFKGFPEPHEKDGEKGKRLSGWSIADTQNVFHLLKKLRLSPSKNPVLEGDVKDTLDTIASSKRKIAILRIDVNMYEPCLSTIKALYNMVSDGGYILFDDYDKWVGYRKAVQEFLNGEPDFVNNDSLPRCMYIKRNNINL